MAYRLRCTVNVDWIGPGAGPMEGLVAPNLPGGGGTGPTLGVVSATGGYMAPGSGSGGVINATDITNLLSALSTDISAQLNSSANLARMQGWTTGNP